MEHPNLACFQTLHKGLVTFLHCNKINYWRQTDSSSSLWDFRRFGSLGPWEQSQPTKQPEHVFFCGGSFWTWWNQKMDTGSVGFPVESVSFTDLISWHYRFGEKEKGLEFETAKNRSRGPKLGVSSFGAKSCQNHFSEIIPAVDGWDFWIFTGGS